MKNYVDSKQNSKNKHKSRTYLFNNNKKKSADQKLNIKINGKKKQWNLTIKRQTTPTQTVNKIKDLFYNNRTNNVNCKSFKKNNSNQNESKQTKSNTNNKFQSRINSTAFLKNTNGIKSLFKTTILKPFIRVCISLWYWLGVLSLKKAVLSGSDFKNWSNIFVKQCGAVGLGIRNIIAKHQYGKKREGCFLLSSCGTLDSHSNNQHNRAKTDFNYSEGEVIKVERNGDEFWWINENTQKEFRTNIKLTADEWAEACFCVQLYASSVQIMKK